MKLRRSLYARPEIVRGEQCAEAPLGRGRSDRAAAWQCSLQSRVLVGGLTAEPSWLPSAACGRRPQQHGSPSSGVVLSGCPDAHRALVALSASSVSVRVSSIRPSSTCPGSARPVRVQGPPVRCPVRAFGVRAAGVRCPVSVSRLRVPSPCPVSVRCPCPVSVRCPCPASVSTLSAPVCSWSAWVRQAARRLGTGRVG
jgi:hypothetical protein